MNNQKKSSGGEQPFSPYFSKGFTLIELMIVLVVIGILVAIAIPTYQDYSIRAKISEGLIIASSEKQAITDAFHSNGLIAIAALSVERALAPTTSKFISKVTIIPATGAIVVTINTGAGTGLTMLPTNSTITLTPFIQSSGGVFGLGSGQIGSIDWACTSATNATATSRGMGSAVLGTLPSIYAPSECK